jgi:hypothetical protein
LANPIINFEGSSLLRAGALGVVILAVLGVATGALPLRCMVSGSCGAQKAAVNPAAVQSQLAPVSTQPLAAPQVAIVAPPQAAPAQPASPSLTANNVLAATFGQLNPQIQTPALTAQPSAPAQQVATAAPEATAPGELKTVKVKTISIKPDGTPILPQPAAENKVRAITVNPDGSPVTQQPAAGNDAVVAQGYAEEPAQAPAARAAEEITQVANVEAGAPTPAPRPAQTAPRPAASSASSSMVIAGSGANVRAKPSKGGNKVLFVLAGGEKVKVGDRQRGWVKVTDDQGRSGWVYEDYLTKG